MDRVYFWLPIIGAIFAWLLYLNPTANSTVGDRVVRAFWALVISFALLWLGVRFYARPASLAKQLEPVELMKERLGEAEQYLTQRKLHFAESLLQQVILDASQIYNSTWSLRETRQRCVETQQAATKFQDQIRAVGNPIIHDLAGALEQRKYEQAVLQLEAARLPADDTFASALQDILWHVISDEINLAQARAGSLSGTVFELQPLERFLDAEQSAIHSRHRSVAQSVKGLVDSTAHSGNLSPKRRGRAMVWDFTKDNIEGAYQMLPDSLRATGRDGVLTMFCIRKREQIQVGTYSVSGSPALQEKMEVAVVYWPARECAGVTTVWGGEPPASRPVSYSPGYGSSIQIKEWIEGLPTDTRIAEARSPIRSIGELQAMLQKQEEEARAAENAERLAKAEQQRAEEAKARLAQQKIEAEKQRQAEQERIAALKREEQARLEEQQRRSAEAARRLAEAQEKAREAALAEVRATEARREAIRWRTWTIGNTGSLDAKFVAMVNTRVTLERRDKTQFKVDLDQLSVQDQAFIRARPWQVP